LHQLDFVFTIDEVARHGGESLCEQNVQRGLVHFAVHRKLLKRRVRMLPLLEQRMPDFFEHLLFGCCRSNVFGHGAWGLKDKANLYGDDWLCMGFTICQTDSI